MQLKYRYALDENGKRIRIDDINPEERSNHSYKCIICGEPLIAKMGNIKVHHFAHKSNVACDGETYLHQLAKQLIKEKYLSNNPFTISLNAFSHCSERSKCPFYNSDECKKEAIKNEDLHKYYDSCSDETNVYTYTDVNGKKRASVKEKENCERYVADLLLWNSKKLEREPISIEINVNHPCETEKINSGLKIIEIKIKNETDIEDIIEGNISGENVTFYNFNAKAEDSVIDGVNIYSRLFFYKSGAIINSTIEDYQYCSERHIKKNPYTVVELNMGYGNSSGFQSDGIYLIGLAYLLNLGYKIKNCMLCQYYKGYEESYTMEPFCANYRKSGIKNPKQKDALQCPCYILNQTKIAQYCEEAKHAPIELV